MTAGLALSLSGMRRYQPSALAAAVIQVAEAELQQNAREVGGNNQGPFVEKYLAPTGLKAPQPWCAAFASWCVREAARTLKVKPPLPYTASTRSIYDAAKARGLLVPEPEAGDLILWGLLSPPRRYGHTGIVVKRSGGRLVTIEGNRTPRVQKFTHDFAALGRILGFVRLP